MENMPIMTELSQKMMDRATNHHLRLPEAISLLQSEANIRRVRDTLSFFSGIPLENGLAEHLIRALTAEIPGAKQDSIRRKVQMWMKDDCLTIQKQSGFQLAFSLHLDPDKADLMLKRLCEEGIHWRDPEEAVYAFSLRKGMHYQEAVALYDEIRTLLASRTTAAEKKEKEDAAVYTEQIGRNIAAITSPEELKEYLVRERGSFGKLHNTAYHLFMEFMELLGMPKMEYESIFLKEGKKEYEEKALVEIKKYASKEIMDTYLYRRFVPIMQRKTKDDPHPEKNAFSAMQRNIRQNWPDEVTLSKMIHRDMDVTRKALILLFLATDGGESEYAEDYSEEYEEEKTPDELFSDAFSRLNLMLTDCGFAGLDPRTQFDWMVLYCMCVSDTIYIDGKMQRFLSQVFSSASDARHENE